MSAPVKMSSTPFQPVCTSSADGHAVARGHAGEHEGLLDVVGVALPGDDARGLLRGVVEQPAHLLRIEARGAGGRRRGAEHAGDAVGAPWLS